MLGGTLRRATGSMCSSLRWKHGKRSIGSRARVADLSIIKDNLLPMVRRLHEGLGTPAEVLINQSAAA